MQKPTRFGCISLLEPKFPSVLGLLLVALLEICPAAVHAELLTFSQSHTIAALAQEKKVHYKTIALCQARQALADQVVTAVAALPRKSPVRLDSERLALLVSVFMPVAITEKNIGHVYSLTLSTAFETDQFFSFIGKVEGNAGFLKQVQAVQADIKKQLADAEILREKLRVASFQDSGEVLKGYNQAIARMGQDICQQLLITGLDFLIFNASPTAARVEFGNIVLFFPAHPEARFRRAQTNMDLKDNQAALEDLNEAIKIIPDNFLGYECRGKANASLGNDAEATRDFSRAIELNPNAHWSYYQRGMLHVKQKKLQDARNDLNKAISLAPNPKQLSLYTRSLSELLP